MDAFYHGDNAKAIAKAVQTSPIAQVYSLRKDINNYVAKERAPVCVAITNMSKLMAPPSSGGMAVLQILKLLEDKTLSQYAVNSPKALHYFTQASRLAFADREVYMADPTTNPQPTQALLDNSYLEKRALLMLEHDAKKQAGHPGVGIAYGKDDAFELPNTSHISIVDNQGNAVSMTTSIEMAFGSTVMVNGYLLNNQLTDFALSPKRDGKYVLNRVEGGKRPRSSMAPVMVFNEDGSLRLVIGCSAAAVSTRGPCIGRDWQLSAQQAINLPRITNRNHITTLEQGTELVELQTQLEQWGHKVRIGDLNSGIHAVEVKGGKLYGSADPRREGIALGK